MLDLGALHITCRVSLAEFVSWFSIFQSWVKESGIIIFSTLNISVPGRCKLLWCIEGQLSFSNKFWNIETLSLYVFLRALSWGELIFVIKTRGNHQNGMQWKRLLSISSFRGSLMEIFWQRHVIFDNTLQTFLIMNLRRFQVVPLHFRLRGHSQIDVSHV